MTTGERLAGRAFPRIAIASVAFAFAAGAWAAEREFEYRTVAGDTLIGLATRFLEDPQDWALIGKRNRVSNPHAIPVGTTLRIPLDRMRPQARTLEVEAVRGAATTQSGPLAAGARIGEGARVATAEGGFVTLRLADGSRVSVPPASEVQIERARSYGNESVVETVLHLMLGRIQAYVRPIGRADDFRVRTRNAATGVRGTQFRVAALDGGAVATEVIEGRVGVEAGAAGAPVEVAASFGTLVGGDGRTLAPVRLLAPPDLSRMPALVERPLVRLPFAAVEGAQAYRAQVGLEAGFVTPVSEGRFTGAEAKFADLPDGAYFVRVRAADRLGLEGLEVERRFVLKARPEPPLVSAPSNRSKHSKPGPALVWSASTEAATYRVQVSAREDFAAPELDERGISATRLDLASRAGVGSWHWRIASVRADGDQGPWSDPSAFTVIPDPPAPKASTAPDGALAFEWGGEAGQRFEFQLAADPGFSQILIARSLDEPKVSFAKPGWGDYYFRVKAIDPDGFQGPYGAAQKLQVPFDAWWLLLLLAPLLL